MTGSGGIRMVGDHRREVMDKVHKAAAEALNDGAKELLRVANVTAPYRKGILADSGDVEEATPRHLTATVGYGGAAAAYAARQHEETTWHHAPGLRAKWLEMAAKEDGRRIMDWVGSQMKAKL